MQTPRAKEHWLFGSGREMSRSSLGFLTELGRASGGFVRFRILNRRFVAVADPECAHRILVSGVEHYDRSYHAKNLGIIIGDGLLSSDGEKWKKNRRQLQPQFRPDGMERLVPAVTRAVERLLKEWEAARVEGKTVPALTNMRRLTISAMARIVFSIDIAAEDAANVDGAIRNAAVKLRRRNTSLVQWPVWMPTPNNRSLAASREVLDEFVERQIAIRTKGPRPELPDMFDALLDARDPDTGEGLTYQDLVDQCKTLLVAGYETTGLALTWTLYLLARHPDAAAKMGEEADRVLQGMPPKWQDLPKLSYTAQVIHESLRLYPPVYAIGRECIKDDEVMGHRVRKGWVLIISTFGMQRSSVWGEDFEAFRPERFAPGSAWPRKAFLPFGSGRHICLGNAFAMTEMMIAVTRICQQYRLEPADERIVEPRGEIALMPEREIELRIARRETTAA